MFTGIVEEKGTVQALQSSSAGSFIRIGAAKILEDIHIGDSIAVNGVCLTVTEFGGGWFRADVMNETLSRSSLGTLRSGSPVNLEQAMPAYGRFGGHIVSGHIDGTGVIKNIRRDGIAHWYTIGAKPEILRYIVEKDSIAIDGISLTVAEVSEESFSVSVIPHTSEETALSSKKPGDIVNLENDIIAKYVERLLSTAEEKSPAGGITMEFLSEHGF